MIGVGLLLFKGPAFRAAGWRGRGNLCLGARPANEAHSMNLRFWYAATGLPLLLSALLPAAWAAGPTKPVVIELTQVPCQFLEPERGKNYGFESTKRTDCEAINEESGEKRLAAAKTLKLKPGRYIFRVTNRSVPYETGFWLRGNGVLDRVSLPSVRGGGLAAGMTRDFEILLEEGEYLYSCHLNPTLSYKLVVH